MRHGAPLDPLIAEQPRDVKLLEMMVQLSDVADEVETAAEYQERILQLADTPENRFRLVQFQLEAGKIDVATALSQRISLLSDPARLGVMIRSSARRNDLATATAICEAAIKADDSLWDVKLLLAQLLLSDRDENFEDHRKRAMELAHEIRKANVAFDALPATRLSAKRKAQNSGVPAGLQSNPMYWSQSSYQLATAMRVGRYADSYGNPFGSQTLLVEPSTFGHARVIAASMIVINAAIGKTGESLDEAIVDIVKQEFAVDNIGEETDAAVLWEQFALGSVQSMLSQTFASGLFSSARPTATPKQKERAKAERERLMELLWRLADIDTQNGWMPLFQILSQRAMAASAPSNQPGISMDPLTESQLESLAKLNERLKRTGFPPSMLNGMPSGVAEMMLQRTVANEFQLAGKPELAQKYVPLELREDADFWEVMGAMQFYLQLEQPEKAGELAARLLPAARKSQKPKAGSVSMSNRFSAMPPSAMSTEFKKKHFDALINSAIAHWAVTRPATQGRNPTLGNGYIRTYTSVGGRHRSFQLRGPLSSRLLDAGLVQSICQWATQGDGPGKATGGIIVGSSSSNVSRIDFPEEMLSALESPMEGALPDEQKARYVLAAYAHWWADRPQKCYEALGRLCEEYDSDVDLQIERARLAAELKQPRLALETLDSFSPLDSNMLIRKEMAAMNLAAEIGDIERAKVAAERLFGMRLDVPTQLALADQLRRLGLADRADAMLERSRTGRRVDAATQIRIANAFLTVGKQESAAEVAYTLFRRLTSGRSQARNVSNYLRQVVSILKSTGRLDPLIENAKRRVESSPKALRPKLELAELYIAAGRQQDANKLWENLSDDDVRMTPQQMVTRGEALVKAKKYDEAVELYLTAFEKEPRRFNSDFYTLTNVVRQAGNDAADKVFKRLAKLPIDIVPSYRYDELVNMGDRKSMSQAKRAYVGRVLKSSFAESEIYSIARILSEEQRKQIPEYREALLRIACSENAFTANSSIWRVRSRGSGGKAYGPLEFIVELIVSDKEAGEKFAEAAARSVELADQKSTAQFLLALVEAKRGNAIAEALQSMRKATALDAEEKEATLLVSAGLLWQAGQILETIDEVPASFLVDLYTESQRGNPSSSSSSRYSVDNRLMQALAKDGRVRDAKSMLLKMYRETDNAGRNIGNPGYGDYQDLQSFQWIAEQLLEIGAPIEALTISRVTLADPAKFVRAKRWGGSRNYQQQFENISKLANGKIKPEVAAQYLVDQVHLWEAEAPIDLMEVSVGMIGKTKSPSSLGQAMEVAFSGKSKQAEDLERFVHRVEKLVAANPESWQLAAVLLMSAHYQGAGVDEHEEELFRRLPTIEEIRSSSESPARKHEHAAFLDLYPVAAVAMKKADSDDERERSERLVRYVEAIADAVEEPAMTLALARITGDTEGSIDKILDALESRLEPGKPLAESAVGQCLRLATDAAKSGQLKASARAVTIALSNGPPLRKISTVGDAFAVATSSSNRPDPNAKKVDAVAMQVTEVLDAWSRATKVALDTKQSNTERGQDDAETLDQFTDALLTIVLPQEREGLCFPYAKQIAGESYDRFSSKEKIEVRSASLALAIAAAGCDRSDKVYELLEGHYQTSKHKEEIAVCLVQVAFADRNADLTVDALGKTSRSTGVAIAAARRKLGKARKCNVDQFSDGIGFSAQITGD